MVESIFRKIRERIRKLRGCKDNRRKIIQRKHESHFLGYKGLIGEDLLLITIIGYEIDQRNLP